MTYLNYRISCLRIRKPSKIMEMKTGLEFNEDYNNYIKSSSQPEGALITVGIDGLRGINARYGHEYGDIVIDTLAECIMYVAEGRPFYRILGGDTFIIFIKEKISAEEAKKIYNNLRNRIDQIHKERHFEWMFTVSAGILIFPQESWTAQELRSYTEFTLYKAKQNGRNCAVIYDSGIYAEYLHRLKLQEQMQRAVEDDFRGFEVRYQPVVDMKRMKTTGAEALLSFVCEGERISPSEFIPILEESGLIIPVGLYAMRCAMQASIRARRQEPSFEIHVNISYVQIKRSDLYGEAMSLLNETGADPAGLVFEITESGFLMDDAKLMTVLNAFRDAGIKIAIDDFGTGYSNFIYLKDARLDIVKLDKVFVANALVNETEYRLLKRIVGIVHELGMKICLEGVETMSELTIFSNDHVTDYVQGYVFGRPASETELLERIKNGLGSDRFSSVEWKESISEAAKQKKSSRKKTSLKRKLRLLLRKKATYRIIPKILPVMIFINVFFITVMCVYNYDVISAVISSAGAETYRSAVVSMLTAVVSISVLTMILSIVMLVYAVSKLEKEDKADKRRRRIYDITQLRAMQSAFEMIASVDLVSDELILVYRAERKSHAEKNEGRFSLYRKDFAASIHRSDRAAYMGFTDPERVAKALRTRKSVSREFRIIHGESYSWEEIILTKPSEIVRSEGSEKITGFIYMIRNVQERKEKEEAVAAERQKLITQLREANNVLFMHGISDALTEVYNREGLEYNAGAILEAAGRGGMKLLFLLADVNKLKSINDTFGHVSGDRAIKMTGEALTGADIKHQLCARIGGDEFVYMAALEDRPGMPDGLIEVFSDILREKNSDTGLDFEVSISYGYYWGKPLEGASLEDYISIADRRMYAMKKNNIAQNRA